MSQLGNLSFVGLGDDPAEASFGAHRFLVKNEVTFSLNENKLEAQHVSYLDTAADEAKESPSLSGRQSESLTNIANIVVGQYDDVQQVEGRPSKAERVAPLVAGPLFGRFGGGS